MKTVRYPLLSYALAGLVAACVPGACVAAPPRSTVPMFAKPARTVVGRYDSADIIELKFRSDDRTHRQDGRWVSRTRGPLPALDALSAAGGPVVGVERLFPDAVLPTAAEAFAGGQPALAQWYRLHLRAGADIGRLVDRLNAMDAVEIAYPAPLPAPAPAATAVVGPAASPSFSERQGYARPASSSGIDADYARTVPGGDGAGIRVVDVEYSWNWQHEDLQRLRVPGTWIRNGTIHDPFNDTDHGTAVMGEMVADDNAFGIRGLVGAATPHYVNVTSREGGYNPARAIALAASAVGAGDVILVEQQIPGPGPCGNFVALEYLPAVYDAVVSAVRRGIHVVEAAGNGNVSLDHPCFGGAFPRGMPDSGAIIVGAGGAQPMPWCTDRVRPRARQGFSSYGRRVNLQGWGQCVAATGYGDMHNGGYNARYTRVFSGTSSASPIVASAVVAVSGVARARGITLSPRQMRDLLVATGTPQVGTDGHIGPLPDLRAAITRLAEPEKPEPCAATGSRP